MVGTGKREGKFLKSAQERTGQREDVRMSRTNSVT